MTAAFLFAFVPHLQPRLSVLRTSWFTSARYGSYRDVLFINGIFEELRLGAYLWTARLTRIREAREIGANLASVRVAVDLDDPLPLGQRAAVPADNAGFAVEVFPWLDRRQLGQIAVWAVDLRRRAVDVDERALQGCRLVVDRYLVRDIRADLQTGDASSAAEGRAAQLD